MGRLLLVFALSAAAISMTAQEIASYESLPVAVLATSGVLYFMVAGEEGISISKIRRVW